ncbi:equilibrative nucleoside transporter 1 [Eurytemora carolleeae]|uniref:equilibrative nucleoside transporter 1 n=1 Tax=Eurytemora carolleeae TaxID=1294199 RepID=UPI000C75BA60|nr:equilibrative nucleoside transporter 1 [Eurytemora carolleeae]|eukprot:XP_023334824.1 equilibrative nucleoside transporter 1-like [Eurytemora affinis]
MMGRIDIKDEYNMVYMIFFYLSVGMLLPWNFFINVNGYWMFKFRTVNETIEGNNTDIGPGKLNDRQLEFTADLALAAMLPNVMFLIVNGLIGHRLRIIPRLIFSLIGVVILFMVTTVFVYVDTDRWQDWFLTITLTTVVLINICNGIFQGGFFGLAGMFPSRYMNAVLTGQGLGGVITALLNIILLAIGGNDVDAAFYCFLLSVVFLSGSVLVFFGLTKTRLFKHYTQSAITLSSEETSLLDPPGVNQEVSLIEVIKIIWEEEITVFLIYVVTLACFPAVTVLVQSTNKGLPGSGNWENLYFVPVSCFLFFNLGDYFGRTLSSINRFPKPGPKLCLLLAVVRIFFIPLFMMCNAVPESRYYTPILIYSDTAYILLIFILSISNGYMTGIVMVSAPYRVPVHLKQTAANFMAGILGVGLAAGAAISSAAVQLL